MENEENYYTYKEPERKENSLIKAGDYEVIIEKMGTAIIPTTGTEKLAITYRIIDDVDQEFKNWRLWEDIWHSKENPKVFNPKRMNQLLGTQAFKDGKKFDSLKAIIDKMLGAHLIVHTEIEFNDRKNKDENVVKYYKTSVAHKPEPEKEVKDEELPF